MTDKPAQTHPPKRQSPQTLSRQDLTHGNIIHHLRRLSLPMVWGIFAIVSTTLIDTYYISLLGTKELAAISFAFTISFAVFSFILGLGAGMSSVISRTRGSGDLHAMRRITLHALLAGTALSIFITLLGLILQIPVFRFMGANEQLMPLILDYMNIWFIGLSFVTVPILANAAMRANGDSMTPAIIMTFSAFLNLVLDPILIFGYFDVPALGMQGAALASVLAYTLTMIPAVYLLAGPKRLLSLHQPDWHLFFDSTRKFLSVGMPAGLANMIQPLSNAIIVGILAGISLEAVAGFGVAVRVQSFVLIPIMALATGLSPIVGQNWGAGKFDRVNTTLRKALQINIIWGLIIAAFLGLFAQHIAAAFSQDPTVLLIAVNYMWIVPISLIGAQTVMLWSAAFNAAGFPKRAFIILNGKIFGLYVPAAYIGSLLGGAMEVFISLALANIIAGIGFHILNRRFSRARQKDRN